MVIGSSPLTRGKRLDAHGRVLGTGLIPAHAGKTRPSSAPCWWGRAHPRSRGENIRHPSLTRQSAGSSPLTRGKLLAQIAAWLPDRLIPAHAGKTLLRARRAGSRSAHPRSRGENVMDATAFFGSWGSSPLTRGKQWWAHPLASSVGLIPAHAGKTRWASKTALRSTAHPRSRGENCGARGVSDYRPGSSPLTRGKP